jgi:hypothetical protein
MSWLSSLQNRKLAEAECDGDYSKRNQQKFVQAVLKEYKKIPVADKPKDLERLGQKQINKHITAWAATWFQDQARS